MITSAGSIFMLRKQTKHLNGTGIYSMKLYPLLPLIFMATYGFVGISIFISSWQTAVTGLGVLAAFMIIYFLTHGRKKTVRH